MEGNIIVYDIYKDETLWLSQKGMSKVCDVVVPVYQNIQKIHLKKTKKIKTQLFLK